MSDDEEQPAPVPSPQNRTIAIAICVAAALALLVGAFTHRWLANPNMRSLGGGLLGMERCDPVSERCETKSNSDVIEELSRDLPVDDHWVGERPEKPSSWFPRLGVITFALALVAAAALLVAAAIAASLMPAARASRVDVMEALRSE